MQTDPAHPLGCLVVLSTTNSSPENRHLQALLAGERHRNRNGLRACVERAIKRGELRPDTNVSALATLFDAVLVGLVMQAREGCHSRRSTPASRSPWRCGMPMPRTQCHADAKLPDERRTRTPGAVFC